MRFANRLGIEYAHRKDIRQAAILAIAQAQELIDASNDIFRLELPTKVREYKRFPERAVQEALANAICHRDYSINDPIVIKQFPEELIIQNPGGFVKGISAENILNCTSKQRNRLLASAMAMLEFVQRAGQGVKKIYSEMLASGRPHPIYAELGDEYKEVQLTINGTLDESFLRRLSSMSNINDEGFNVYELIVLYHLNKYLRATQADVERLLNQGTGFVSGLMGALEAKGMVFRVHGEYFASDLKGDDFEARYPIYKAVIKKALSVGTELTKRDILAIIPLERSEYLTLIGKLKAEGVIEQLGDRKSARYRLRAPQERDL